MQHFLLYVTYEEHDLATVGPFLIPGAIPLQAPGLSGMHKDRLMSHGVNFVAEFRPRVVIWMLIS